MKGAIIGDIIGSIYEYNNIKTKNFPLFQSHCFYTDDSIMTVAIAKGILYSRAKNIDLKKSLILSLRTYGQKYPFADYGIEFGKWLTSNSVQPYNSYGNGALMRCSACGWLANSEQEAIELGNLSAGITHNHPTALKACELYSKLIYLAKHGIPKDELKHITIDNYSLPKLDEIRNDYKYDITCDGTFPVALSAFFESIDFEDAIRNAVSIGGDTDTICAITGGLAEAHYGIPTEIVEKASIYIPKDFYQVWNLT